jgi:hypothetical protein
MRGLLLSTVVYLLGVAAVLYFRPHLMFYRDGRWKEFGIEDGTMFPFWLFCIVWAIASYLISWLLVGFGSGSGAGAVSASLGAASLNAVASARMSLREAFEPEEESHAVEPLPVPRKNRNAAAAAEPGTMKPGYYRLNANATRATGVPKYIYVGPEEPEDE